MKRRASERKSKTGYQLDKRLVRDFTAYVVGMRGKIEEAVAASMHHFLTTDPQTREEIMVAYTAWADSDSPGVFSPKPAGDERPASVNGLPQDAGGRGKRGGAVAGG
jgi:hypothetical protein